MAKQKTLFRWKCLHCDRRNVHHWVQTFDFPNRYAEEYPCNHCGTHNKVAITLEVTRPSAHT